MIWNFCFALRKQCIFLIFLSLNNAQSCRVLWGNSCISNEECCTKFCDKNNGQWALGVCKPGFQFKFKTNDQINTQCKPIWDATCSSNKDCCSNNCNNNNGQWVFGVCK